MDENNQNENQKVPSQGSFNASASQNNEVPNQGTFATNNSESFQQTEQAGGQANPNQQEYVGGNYNGAQGGGFYQNQGNYQQGANPQNQGNYQQGNNPQNQGNYQQGANPQNQQFQGNYQQNQFNNPNYQQRNFGRKPKNKKLIIIVGVVAAIIVAFAGYFLFFSKTNVDVTENIVLYYSGYGGGAYARVKSNNINYSKKNDANFQRFVNSLTYTFDSKNGKYKNGDKVTVTVSYNAEYAAAAKVNPINLEKTFVAKGITTYWLKASDVPSSVHKQLSSVADKRIESVFARSYTSNGATLTYKVVNSLSDYLYVKSSTIYSGKPTDSRYIKFYAISRTTTQADGTSTTDYAYFYVSISSVFVTTSSSSWYPRVYIPTGTVYTSEAPTTVDISDFASKAGITASDFHKFGSSSSETA